MMVKRKTAGGETAATPAGPFATLLDYERRSLAHRPGRPELVQAPGYFRGVGYRVGPFRLVSQFVDVLEILPVPPLTPVPGATDWMLGVANVRGNLLPVVDLKRFLLGERSVAFEGQRMLVVRQAGGNVAVLVDEFFGQRGFAEADGGEPPEQLTGHPRMRGFVTRSYRLGEVSWSVFDMGLLTRTPEFRQAAA